MTPEQAEDIFQAQLSAAYRNIARSALAELKSRGLEDGQPTEPPHCDECFEGCDKCHAS
jgi:hypothetical protein